MEHHVNLRFRLTVLAVALLASVVAASADGSVYLKGITPTLANPGQTITLRTASGVHLYALLPLYVIRRDVAPKERSCPSGRGICEPHVAGPPTGAAYRRIGTLNFRHASHQNVVFSAPMTMGRYVFVFYCGPCYHGSGGSLVTTPRLVLTVR
jgi:hypothetical protein